MKTHNITPELANIVYDAIHDNHITGCNKLLDDLLNGVPFAINITHSPRRKTIHAWDRFHVAKGADVTSKDILRCVKNWCGDNLELIAISSSDHQFVKTRNNRDVYHLNFTCIVHTIK